MRSKIAVLTLALAIGAASSAAAQKPAERDKQDRRGKQGQQVRGDNRGFGALLKGIDLSAEQKTQLQTLRSQRDERGDRAQNERGERNKETREQLKAARERGDTAFLRQFRAERGAEMKQRHEAMLRDVRAILTPAQREVFDRNVADAAKRIEERGKRGKRAGGRT